MTAPLGARIKADQETLESQLGLPPREARNEIFALLGKSLGKSRAWLMAHDRDPVPEEALTAYLSLLRRRLAGEPVAYILGEREFFGLRFQVTPDVLIPRPETEHLVELALQYIPLDSPSTVLDLGTGSGAVALAIAAHRPLARITAVDCSLKALQVARQNSAAQNAPKIEFRHGDWFSAVEGDAYDVIVSNPPYIPENDVHLRQGDLRFEPPSALASGRDGLNAIRTIISHAPEFLVSGGWLLFEHGYDQGEPCRALMRTAGFDQVSTMLDLAGLDRVTSGQWH